MHAVLPNAEIPFRVEMPFDAFYKAGEAGTERRISGVISTEHRDKQGEVVKQRGLEFDDFLSAGWFNDNHSKKTAGVVGYPIKVEPTTVDGKPATRVEGYLLEGHPPADELWSLAQALQKTNRRLGFSVEGSIVQREGADGRVIAKAKVRNVAITNCPVNAVTGMDIVSKSMAAVEQGGEALRRAMMAGADVAAPAGPAAPGNGFALRGESLLGVSSPAQPPKRRRKRRTPAGLSKAEACATIAARFPAADQGQVERIYKWALQSQRRKES
jgi:hypothetical protein